ncbi:MAG TPA: family 16 glycoside hydrolase [Ktedonobacterales bacterium]|nr:family 16 glycoside hydrolase [Ktedonobacterales bacterium]
MYSPSTSPSAPMYTPSVPPSYPPMQPPGGMAPLPPAPTPPRRGRSGLIIGTLLVLIVLLAGGLGVSLYALNARNAQQRQTGGATSTAAPSPTPTPGEVVLFQDSLTSNTNGWANDANESHCFFKDKSYHVKDGYYCLAPAGSVSDANITVQVKQVAGSLRYAYGIVFRRASPGNWYEFDIDSNSKWVFRAVINNSSSTLVPYTPNTAIKGGLNQVNTLRVQAKGTHFTFYVNGIKVGEAADTMFSSGYSGLSADGADTEVAYNNFQITAAG